MNTKFSVVDGAGGIADDVHMNGTSDYFCRLWELGQDHLGAGRYVAACGFLEKAGEMAWRVRDARSLARLYLPLLEARRQIRLSAVEGVILVGGAEGGERLRRLAGESDGTFILRYDMRAKRLAGTIAAAAGRAGKCVEVLFLLERGDRVCLASRHAATLASGVAVRVTGNGAASIPGSTDEGLVLPLPPAGRYLGRDAGLGGMARESLLIGWEALALRWQARHRLARGAGPWEEMAWLRTALRIDLACEPVAMRLIAVAEGIERRRT
jgi:hypothetical protein